MFNFKAWSRGLNIVLDVEPEVPYRLVGDPSRLNQILINLLTNAIKFTNSGEITILVKIVDEREGQITLEFSVEDMGIGISETHKNALFEAFNQADGSTTRKYGGTGLGLAICKNLTELMGGEISVTSSLNQGSRFNFTLPFIKIPASDLSEYCLPANLLEKSALVVGHWPV